MNLILHPDPRLRDPFGVLTVGQLCNYDLYLNGYRQAWEDRNEMHYGRPGYGPRFEYAEARDALLRLCDMPYLTACMVALWHCRDARDMFFLSFPRLP